ncbi:hypothetical protein SAMN05421878_1026 [Actinobaculum suis]|uniref:Uncharacterized protein n=1 Tax=Actinobaculum suis TaxID=1657 RepID=A0A1G7A075_9ACTO|nr:hypothetical protein SAMN05421878_1026 [Actinobaculum suis]
MKRLAKCRMTLLRTRGGISVVGSRRTLTTPSSPHARRYFLDNGFSSATHSLFSARAEVFPRSVPLVIVDPALLRTRGGISRETAKSLEEAGSLLRTRGGISRETAKSLEEAGSLLRTRGGISGAFSAPPANSISSPHARRYFQLPLMPHRNLALFSARAEVFPVNVMHRAACSSLLRTRGGISQEYRYFLGRLASSPHARRYFP